MSKIGQPIEMNKLLEAYNFSWLNQEETQNLNRSITSNKMKAVIKKKKLPINKSPGPHSFTGEFCETFKELIPILHKLFQKIEEKWMI